MLKDALLTPLQFRFTDPKDVQEYGPDWHTYDELAIATTPARDLVRLEATLGVPLVDIMNGVRVNSILGDTGAAWLALHFEGHPVQFEDFSPAVMLLEWRKKPEDEGPKEDGAVSLPTPEDPAFESLEPSATDYPQTHGSTTSTLGDTVVLRTLPVVE